MAYLNVQNMNALDASKDEAGAAIPTPNAIAFSAQAIVTGTSTGNLNVQYSNDINPVGGVPVNWSTIATIGTVAIAGAGVYAIPQFQCSYRWLRTQFAHTNAASGTITVNCDLVINL